ncbi:YnfA family protein [Acidithiobacillus thiooxidans]|uniref:YnfA family protein n=1 Tax=Acidithiobacillus thiooxidans TaxID=930 RepID=UPI0020CB0808|nr:YnfA family protein [Acidithiobacillus thiooxidans]
MLATEPNMTNIGMALKLLRILLLFVVTALAEIVGCYLPWLVIKQDKPLWLLLPAAISLGVFAWLLTLHPTTAGRTYAAYGGVYIAVAIGWLWVVEGIRPSFWDVIGSLLALTGMAVIMFAPRG